MIIYSVTVKPSKEIITEFLNWLKDIHTVEVLDTDCFDSCKIFKILEENEVDGYSINIQYFTTSLERYFNYIDTYSSELRQKGLDKFGDNFIAFRTLLKEI